MNSDCNYHADVDNKKIRENGKIDYINEKSGIITIPFKNFGTDEIIYRKFNINDNFKESE